MSSELLKLTGPWTTDLLPTKTTLTHINPTAFSGIVETLLSASAAYPTITKNIDLYDLARKAKGAQASLKVISAQHYIATATATQEFPRMTQIIWNATMELQDLEMGYNLYQMELSYVANALFAVLFAVLLLAHTGICIWKKYLYFGICFALGTGLEFSGYVARLAAIGHYSEKNPYLCQIISLTLAPALIMAGIYYLLAQLLVIYGRQYCRIKPLWFSYIFIFCDISSLMIQAAGGGLAAIMLQRLESTAMGTHIMLAGIGFQVVSMTLFLWLMFEFLWRIYFRASAEVTFLLRNFFCLLFQTKGGRRLQNEYLFRHYNPKYSHIWTRRIFGYYPLAIITGVAFIYIRCVYRLVELSEGWTGYTMTHEEFVMTLDGLQVLLTCILFIPFHPGFIMGKGANISMTGIKRNDDQEENLDGETPSQYFNEKCSMSLDERSFYTESSSWSSFNAEKQDAPQTPMNPYFIPKLPVAPPSPPTRKTSSRHSASSFTRKEAPQEKLNARPSADTKHSEKKSHPWYALKRGSGKVDPYDIVAIPYDRTTEQPLADDFPIPNTPTPSQRSKASDRSKASSRSMASSRSKTPKRSSEPPRAPMLDSFSSLNPYTRSLYLEDIGTLGPYELYGLSEKLKYGLQHSFVSQPRQSRQSEDCDVFSQVSNDEFFFSFGAQK